MQRMNSRGSVTARGGKRPGAGRPPRAGVASGRDYHVRVSEAEEAELHDGLLEGETISSVMRDGALALVRRRSPPRR